MPVSILDFASIEQEGSKEICKCDISVRIPSAKFSHNLIVAVKIKIEKYTIRQFACDQLANFSSLWFLRNRRIFYIFLNYVMYNMMK